MNMKTLKAIIMTGLTLGGINAQADDPTGVEMNGTKYSTISAATWASPSNATEASVIKVLDASGLGGDRRTYEYWDESGEVPEAERKPWCDYFYIEKSDRTLVVDNSECDFWVFEGRKVEVDINSKVLFVLDGGEPVCMYMSIGDSELTISDSSGPSVNAVLRENPEYFWAGYYDSDSVTFNTNVFLNLGIGCMYQRWTSDVDNGKLNWKSGCLVYDGTTPFLSLTSSVFAVEGGCIFGNDLTINGDKASSVNLYGGDVRCEKLEIGGGLTLNLKGDVVVDHIHPERPNSAVVYLSTNTTFNLVGDFTGRIGLWTTNDVEGAVIGNNPGNYSGAENIFCGADLNLVAKTVGDKLVWAKKIDAVCKVGAVEYETLAEAMAATVTSGEKIELIKDVALSGAGSCLEVVEKGQCYIDLMGHKITGDESDGLFYVGSYGHLTIVDSVGGGELSGGYADDNSPGYGCGGGIYSCGNLVLSNLTITACSADDCGGGVMLDCEDVDEGSLTMIDCAVTDCSAESGGGVFVYCEEIGSKVKLRNCAITQNSAADCGGLYAMSCEVEIEGCSVKDNSVIRFDYDCDMAIGCITSIKVSGDNDFGNVGTVVYEGVNDDVPLFSGTFLGTKIKHVAMLLVDTSTFELMAFAGEVASGYSDQNQFESIALYTGKDAKDSSIELYEEGKYELKVENGKLVIAEIVMPGEIEWTASGYSAAYDGKAHTIAVTVSAPDGVTPKYATSAAGPYSATVPTFTDATASAQTVWFVLEKEGYVSVTNSRTVAISKRNLSLVTVAAIADVQETGAAITPVPTVTDGSPSIIKTSDYTVSYEDNIAPGTAKVILTGAGNYTGTKSVTFTITEKPDPAGVFTYTNNTDGVSVTITGLKSPSTFSGTLTIPADIDGKVVTALGKKAFLNVTGITAVDFPPAALAIGDYAFSGCTALTSVYFPADITAIGNFAFANCQQLKEVTMLGKPTLGLYPFIYAGKATTGGAPSLKIDEEVWNDTDYRAKLSAQCPYVTISNEAIVTALQVTQLSAPSAKKTMTLSVKCDRAAEWGTVKASSVKVLYQSTLDDAAVELPLKASSADADGNVTLEVETPEGTSGFFRLKFEN